jgi:two-component system, NarL family, response regulator LiaR
MSAAAQQGLVNVDETDSRSNSGQIESPPNSPVCDGERRLASAEPSGNTVRVYVVAENRLLREGLARMLGRQAGMELAGVASNEPLDGKALVEGQVDVLVMVSQDNLEEDLDAIRAVHNATPAVRILLIGATRAEGEFLRCVRAGISGLLWREASAEEVVAAIRAVRAGEAVCPGELCKVLFRYFEQDSSELPCAGVQQRLGLTRREQQLIPLIAKGLTNKEIANHFCLSEQTVKNHLYRIHAGGERRRGNCSCEFASGEIVRLSADRIDEPRDRKAHAGTISRTAQL